MRPPAAARQQDNRTSSLTALAAALFLLAGAARAQQIARLDAEMAAPASSSLRAHELDLPDAPEMPQAQPAAVADSASTSPGGILRTPGGAIVPRAIPGPLSLSLDQAIALGIEHNEQLEQTRIQDRAVRGEILTVFNALLPTLSASASSSAQEINLAGMGFKPNLIAKFGFAPGSIATIVKVNVTSAQLNLDQALFNLPDYYLFRGAQKAADATALRVLNGRGGVTVSVGSQYLRTLADVSRIADATSLLEQDKAVLRQATAMHDAGVSPNLDVLRARVEEQMQEQAVIQAENNFAKDKILLNRAMGIPAEQELKLTDAIPYAELAERPLADALTLAYARRKDLLALEAEVEASERERKAARAEYLPTVAINGYYGVLGQTTGSYHGDFVAQATLKIPIFKEAQFRGEREVAEAQLYSLRQQIASLRVTIEQQIRASMLDVESSAERVKVAKSSVDLAAQELADTTDRYKAGVDDSLPLVEAQATLANAQTQLIDAIYQNNVAKLNLARNTGVVETQYRSYLGR